MTVLCIFPPVVNNWSASPISLPLVLPFFIAIDHSDRSNMNLKVVLLSFPWQIRLVNISVILSQLYFIVEELSTYSSSSNPFVNWIFCFPDVWCSLCVYVYFCLCLLGHFYILYFNPLRDVLLQIIFHSIGSYFVQIMLSFAIWKLFSSIGLHLIDGVLACATGFCSGSLSCTSVFKPIVHFLFCNIQSTSSWGPWSIWDWLFCRVKDTNLSLFCCDLE